MSTHETPYATVEIVTDGVSISAHNGQLWDWSHRPGTAWPCSTLEELDSLTCGFGPGGLNDLVQDPPDKTDWSLMDGDDSVEIDGHEFNAWSSDALREVLPKDHPAWFVCVGQFENGE